jgi:hypothetical protein
MPGAGQDAHRRKILAQPIHHRLAVGIDHHLGDLCTLQQGIHYVVEKRLACHETVILPGHALGMVAHGDEGNDARE